MAVSVKHRRWATIAVLGVGTLAWGVGSIPAPRAPVQPYSAAYNTTTTGQAGIAQPTQPPAVVAPTAGVTLPAVYGDEGLAGEYAAQLGHGSMSEACENGVTWTCGVTRVKPAANYEGGTTTTREVYAQTAVMDGDATAAEFLNRSPAVITKIVVKDASAFLIVDVGTATRTKTGKADQ